MQVDPVAAIVAIVTILLAVGGFARFLLGKSAANRDDLAAFKLHASETYVTKQGMHEQTAQIVEAVASVRNEIRSVDMSVEQLNQRIDRVIESAFTK